MSVGEAACVSVHGANRLGSNSLLDLVVFGKSAAKRCASIIKPKDKNKIITDENVNPIIDKFEKIRNSNGKNSISKIREEMQHTMQNYCPVYRSEEKMKEGKKIILGAHYDTDLFVGKGAGADDNASGVAMLLELAERMQKYNDEFARAGICLEFAFFDAEEQPYEIFGSDLYSDELMKEYCTPQLMINFDMIGYFDNKKEGSLSKVPDHKNFYIIEKNNHTKDQLAEELKRMIQNFATGAKVIDPKSLGSYPVSASDNIRFSDVDIPVLHINTGAHSNPYYHTDADRPETLDYKRMANLSKAIEKFLLQQIKKDPA